MRNNSMKSGLRVLIACSLGCLLIPPCYAQGAGPRAVRSDAGEPTAVTSAGDRLSLVERIKAVESPAFRAYLHARVSAWLWQSAGGDESLRKAAAEEEAAGLADIHKHSHEIPQVSAARFYDNLLSLVRRHNAEEAERLKRLYPPAAGEADSAEAEAGNAFYAALAKLNNPQTEAQGLELAARLIISGSVPPQTLLGELSRLDQSKSRAAVPLLAAALTLEERRMGALPFQIMFFLSHLYLKDGTPPGLQGRFVAASLRATRAAQTELLRGDPITLSWAVKLLHRVTPAAQKLSPSLYPEAAAQVAALAPGVPPDDAVFRRIKESPDPLAQALTEADQTTDKRLKSQLIESAARLAREQGKLRQAAELVASLAEDHGGQPEDYSHRDELLDGILETALERSDPDTARFAASKIELPGNRSDALLKVARYSAKRKDAQAVSEALSEAAKALEGAKDGREKALSYFRLTAAVAELDAPRTPAVAAEAVKAANNIPRPADDPQGEFDWSLYPVADAAVKTFQALARVDRQGALSLAETFNQKHFRVAATLGVYSLSAQ